MSPYFKKLLFVAAFPVFPALCLSFCHTQKPSPVTEVVPLDLPYDLQNPSLTITFDNEDLKEISALSPSDEKGSFLAISDERGEFFFIDANNNGAIIRRVLFREKGDFEGAEMVENTLWALKSDGKLFEVSNWKSGMLYVEEFATPLKKEDDVEGLGYDASRHTLLLACKGDPDSAYLRLIYGFDLNTKKMQDKPLYAIDPKAVNLLVPYIESEKQDFFSPSGVAKHPLTGDIYVISTALKRLVVLDKDSGKIRFATRLDKKIMPQPEGIAFDTAGNLYISSEGKRDNGQMLKFNYRNK